MTRFLTSRSLLASFGYFIYSLFVCHGLSTDECNYGFVENLFIPESVCQTLSINGENQFNDTSYQFGCDYNGTESSGIAYHYNNVNCSGSPARAENVSDFHCCRTCQSTCDTVLLGVTFYQDSDDAHCNGTIKKEANAKILDIEGCHTSDTGIPFYQQSGPDYWLTQVFLESGCAGDVSASVNFTDGVCQLATGFSTPARIYVNVSKEEGSTNGETCCNGSNTSDSTTTTDTGGSTTREPETTGTGMGSTAEVDNSGAERPMAGHNMTSAFVVLLTWALIVFAACEWS